jgi:quercetin dioxygenase-like cupin family protein
MKIERVPFEVFRLLSIAPTSHDGERGHASWHTLERGNVRVRIVDYSPGYSADHWCARGHVMHVLAGELVTELDDGRTFTLHAGDGYVVADDDGKHRSRTTTGARLLIVD